VACYCSERKVAGGLDVARCGRVNAKCNVARVLALRGVHSLRGRRRGAPCSKRSAGPLLQYDEPMGLTK
jgi:hypothetical protein